LALEKPESFERKTPEGGDLQKRATQHTGTYTNERAVYLPLGSDEDCPFAAPEHWAAFTATGI
jgi:hypothetical protein